jgi:diadenosine tetraphosphate (Ap4A) HIT family hydrolase/ADP-ribose pyrophosphatase YjhB (NUDIX family)
MKIDQETMKNARTTGNYGKIWQTTGKCVFCDLRDKYILYEENGIVLVVSLYAYIDGHMMAIPRRHVRSPKELTQSEWETFRKFSYIAKNLIRDVHKHKGMWSVIKQGFEAQATVSDHLHMHFIPFDSPDLCEWNYRKLNYTPLENVDLYKKEGNEIIKNLKKFEKKYSQESKFHVVCDAIIMNKKNQILFQERGEKYKFEPDNLTLPGGHIDTLENGLEVELVRELKEELCYEFNPKDFRLADSRSTDITFRVKSSHLAKSFTKSPKFIWNTYLLKDFTDEDKLCAGDDCEKLIWLDVDEALKHERVSEEIKEII